MCATGRFRPAFRLPENRKPFHPKVRPLRRCSGATGRSCNRTLQRGRFTDCESIGVHSNGVHTYPLQWTSSCGPRHAMDRLSCNGPRPCNGPRHAMDLNRPRNGPRHAMDLVMQWTSSCNGPRHALAMDLVMQWTSSCNALHSVLHGLQCIEYHAFHDVPSGRRPGEKDAEARGLFTTILVTSQILRR